MRRTKLEATGSRRRLLFAVAAVLGVGAVGAAIAVIAAGGSSGVRPVSTASHAASAASTQRPSTRAHHRISAVALARRYARERRRAARRRGPRNDRTSRRSLQPATRGVGAFGPTRNGKTSCSSVVHIGDSTSEGLDSSSYLPNRAERIGSRYAHVGATTWHPEISGATSIVETLPGGTNAQEVARQLLGQGYRGCWVIALGTNDAADVAVGSTVGLATRIERMMSTIGNQPVMWVNVRSLVSSGPYAESNMQSWDAALLQACARYPNMRVFDWASVVKDGWFIPDGIHYTTPGYAARGRLIAGALAEAFPASGDGSSCVVG